MQIYCYLNSHKIYLDHNFSQNYRHSKFWYEWHVWEGIHTDLSPMARSSLRVVWHWQKSVSYRQTHSFSFQNQIVRLHERDRQLGQAPKVSVFWLDHYATRIIELLVLHSSLVKMLSVDTSESCTSRCNQLATNKATSKQNTHTHTTHTNNSID